MQNTLTGCVNDLPTRITFLMMSGKSSETCICILFQSIWSRTKFGKPMLCKRKLFGNKQAHRYWIIGEGKWHKETIKSWRIRCHSKSQSFQCIWLCFTRCCLLSLDFALLYLYYLMSLELDFTNEFHLVWIHSNWCHLISIDTIIGVISFHLISNDVTWFRLISGELDFTTRFHLISFHFTWLYLMSIDCMWFQLISLDVI